MNKNMKNSAISHEFVSIHDKQSLFGSKRRLL